jgi:hypothetical protein
VLKTLSRSSFLTSKVCFRLTDRLGLIEKEDDEVLFAIAEELGKVWYDYSIVYLIFNRELLPDKTQFLGLLEVLARADETVVREQVFNIND